MRIYFTKAYWKVFGIAAVTLVIIILGITAYGAFKDRDGKYMEFENEYGGMTFRVTKEKGGFTMPKEFPTDIVDIYHDLRLRDAYIIKDKNNEIVEIELLAYSGDDTETVKKYYEEKDKRTINKNYEATFIISETNSEFLPKDQHVSEKTELTIIAKRK